jgi:hypothetical protein
MPDWPFSGCPDPLDLQTHTTYSRTDSGTSLPSRHVANLTNSASHPQLQSLSGASGPVLAMHRHSDGIPGPSLSNPSQQLPLPTFGQRSHIFAPTQQDFVDGISRGHDNGAAELRKHVCVTEPLETTASQHTTAADALRVSSSKALLTQCLPPSEYHINTLPVGGLMHPVGGTPLPVDFMANPEHLKTGTCWEQIGHLPGISGGLLSVPGPPPPPPPHLPAGDSSFLGHASPDGSSAWQASSCNLPTHNLPHHRSASFPAIHAASSMQTLAPSHSHGQLHRVCVPIDWTCYSST